MLLGDLYLKNGRFQSAETTFADVMELDPSNQRAQLSIALAQIALGRNGAALAQLDRLAEVAAPGDVGLAYALAGQPRRAIELLEPATREATAGPRVRQNLALAYALAGDWQKARTTAAQDVSPAELSARLQHWAALAQPKASWDQVAALLNVKPAHDPGQPVRLALAPAKPASSAYAEAAPLQVPAPEPVVAPAPAVRVAAAPAVPNVNAPAAKAPVTLAAIPAPAAPAQLVPDWVSADGAPVAVAAAEAPVAVVAEETRPVYADAVQALVTPQPAVLRASAPAVKPVQARFERAVAKPTVAAAPRTAVFTGPGRFAVQLGAFSSPAAVERAWANAYKRYGFNGQTPLSTTVAVAGKGTLHRLSVAGFASHADASRVCAVVKAKGGACFVRAVAGDTPVRWAFRYNGRKAG
jgi:hypothetical protein